MNVAMFTDAYFPRINGVSVSVNSYANELVKLGHTVCVVCVEYSEEQQKSAFFDEKASDEASPFKIIRIPSSWLIWSKEDRLARLDQWHFVKKSMDAFRPDTIHINSEWLVGYFGALYARHRHIPYVYTFHTMWEDYIANYVSFLPEFSTRKIGKEVVKFYLKRAAVIIAPTRRIADVVERYGINHPVEILPTGIPEEKEKFNWKRSLQIKARLFRKFPAIKGKKILLYVGRIVKEKNLSFLFDVLREIQKTDSRTVLLLVGGGPYADELQALAHERGIAGSVFFTGYIPGADLIYFYRLADVFVFPSKTETQGLVTVEAMLSGLPVVAIGEMGTIDVMQGDNGGFMVAEDPVLFAQRVHQLLSDSELHRIKSDQARKWGKKWSISALTPLLVSCYQKAAADKSDQEIYCEVQ
jgi:1,2-diacylglycerol 3-alpha-glucosyltransferase